MPLLGLVIKELLCGNRSNGSVGAQERCRYAQWSRDCCEDIGTFSGDRGDGVRLHKAVVGVKVFLGLVKVDYVYNECGVARQKLFVVNEHCGWYFALGGVAVPGEDVLVELVALVLVNFESQEAMNSRIRLVGGSG